MPAEVVQIPQSRARLNSRIAPGGTTHLEDVISEVRAYFVLQYHAGTREMIARVVREKLGDVPDHSISKALQFLKNGGNIIHEKHVWWFLHD